MNIVHGEELSCLLETLRSLVGEDEQGRTIIKSEFYGPSMVKDILMSAESEVDYLRWRSGQITEQEYHNMWPEEPEYDPYEGFEYLDEDEDEDC